MVGNNGNERKIQAEDLTVEQTAIKLAVTTDDVYGYIASGELEAWSKTEKPCPKKAKYRIPLSAIEEFRRNRIAALRDKNTKPTKPPPHRKRQHFVNETF
jgi:hypothetical protein